MADVRLVRGLGWPAAAEAEIGEEPGVTRLMVRPLGAILSTMPGREL